MEWVCIVSGEGLLRLKDVRTGEEQQVPPGENNMVTVQISPYTARVLTNTGDRGLYLAVDISEERQFDDPAPFHYTFAEL